MSVRLTEKFIKENPELIEEYIQRETINPTPPKIYKRHIDVIVKFNSYKRLKNINRPTLIMQGKQDLISPVQNAELLANNIRGAKLAIFEDKKINDSLRRKIKDFYPEISISTK